MTLLEIIFWDKKITGQWQLNIFGLKVIISLCNRKENFMKTFNMVKLNTDLYNRYEKEKEILLEYSKHSIFLEIELYKKKGYTDKMILEVEKLLMRFKIDEEALKQYHDFISRFDNYKI